MNELRVVLFDVDGCTRKKQKTRVSSLSLAENGSFSCSSVRGLTGLDAKLSFASSGLAARMPFARGKVFSVWKML